jgi:hypothetical protein
VSQILLNQIASLIAQGNVASAVDLVKEERGLSEEQKAKILAKIAEQKIPLQKNQNVSGLNKRLSPLNVDEDPVSRVFSIQELLALISSYLPKSIRNEIRCVSKSFNLAIDTVYIAELNELKALSLDEFIDFCKALKLTGKESGKIFSYCKRLETLILTRVRQGPIQTVDHLERFFSPILQIISSECPQFKQLCVTDWFDVGDSFLISLASPQVTTLSIERCYYPNLELIVPSSKEADSFPNLNRLILRDHSAEFLRPLDEVSEDVLNDFKEFFKKATHLRTLKLEDYSLTGEQLAELIPLWKDLKELHLLDMQTKNCLPLITKHCKDLTVLNLTVHNVSYFENADLKGLTCPSLTDLNLSTRGVKRPLTDKAIYQLVARHPKLLFLNILGQTKISHRCLTELRQLHPNLEIWLS